jgi:DNA-binding NtrC family response regulator
LEGPPREPGGREKAILLVEDSDVVRAVVARMLTEGGFAVIEAAGPKEAEAILRREDTPLGLLLTDIVMPESSGIELAERAERLRPGLRILLMTGYSEEAAEGKGIGGNREWIAKPFTQEQIVAKVRNILSIRNVGDNAHPADPTRR